MMETSPPQKMLLLLVEDNPADADFVEELLEQTEGDSFTLVRAPRLSDAVERLKDTPTDIVLLDLRLPDGSGVHNVQALRSIDRHVPIVVLTGAADEALALDCINAGAQDYLCKSEIRPTSLRRSIDYAILRLRESMLREIEQTLNRYRAMSTRTVRTSVTASLAGTGAVRERYPDIFLELVDSYVGLVTVYCEQQRYKRDKPREAMERVVSAIGDAGGGPRDLIDVHVAALDQMVASLADKSDSSLLIEARLLALEMMGLLVDYYRVGLRRMRPGRLKA